MTEAFREMFIDAFTNASKWGPGLLLALVMLYGLYRILLRLGEKVGLRIIGALEKPAAALTQQAEALTKQSQSMDNLTKSIEHYVRRDHSEHREIMMLQKVILDRIEGIRNGHN